MNLESLGEDARSILHLDTGDHHAGSSLSPVHRSGHLPPGGQLETVDHSDDLIEVPAGGGGVEQRQLQSSVWTNDEHSSRNFRIIFHQRHLLASFSYYHFVICKEWMQLLTTLYIRIGFSSYLQVRGIPALLLATGSSIPYF